MYENRVEAGISKRELVETALHVLVAWNDGRNPTPANLALLRRAFPASAHLPDDELACQVIHDLSSIAFAGPNQPSLDNGNDAAA